MFITFEGIDFSGKSTQVKLIEKFLNNRGEKVKLIREPGGTEISEKIRELLLDKKNSKMVSGTELLLFSASRIQLINEIILPHLENNYYVISDRFHDSLTAYQGFGRGISLDFISMLNDFVLQNCKPDITFFIDIPLCEVERRKSLEKDFVPDRIEKSKDDFYQKVRNGYLEIASKEERFIIINGLNSIEEIHNQIKNLILEKSDK